VEPHGTLTTTSTTTTVPAPPAAAPPGRRRAGTGSTKVQPIRVTAAPHEVGLVPGSDVLPAVHNLVQNSVSHPQAPISLALIVLLFLLVQHHIDRRDPKLAEAPRDEPDDLEFGTAIRFA